ncbi:MAG: hypothetical protein HY778_17020, partial [Betaproteobacteria bacterium]|nr:hypothetical protein [Betaproteobacteria bacterium]
MIKPGSLPAPGLVWGGYPQREVAPATWGEHVLAGLSATATALAGRAAGRRARFVERVRQCAQWAGSLSADSARADLRALRTQLGRYGLEEALVAECFGWTIQAVQARMGVRLHDTQIIAGWIMSRGRLAEMATGEGKTLAAALPAIACAMAGSPVHVITANDYLVRRDAELLRPVYGDLGLSVGVVTADMEPDARRVAYGADVVYCTAKELVFDYLRDRLAGLPPSDLHRHARALVPARGAAPRPLLRGLCMAVIDEADSILIDEARSPLITS